MGSLWVIFVALVCGYVFTFALVRRFNEWYYVSLLGKTKYHLPPGDMGWPLLGNLAPFLKAFISDNPYSFLNTLVSRYGQTSMYKTYLFGNPSIIVCSLETCKKVMTNDEQFKLGYPKATMILTDRRAFPNISNIEHKRLCRLTTTPINGHEELGMYVEVIENITVNYLKEWSDTNELVELLSKLRKVSFKVIAYTFMGPGKEKVIEAVRDLYTDLNIGIKSQVIKIPSFAFHKAFQVRKQLASVIPHIISNGLI